jgi:hypothetical protein
LLSALLAIQFASQLACYLFCHPAFLTTCLLATCLAIHLSSQLACLLLVMPSSFPHNLLATCLAIQLSSQLACYFSCHPALLTACFLLNLPSSFPHNLFGTCLAIKLAQQFASYLPLNKLMFARDNFLATSSLHGRFVSLLAFHLSIGRRVPIITAVVTDVPIYCFYIRPACFKICVFLSLQ